MNYGKAIAVCGAIFIAAVAVGAAAFPLHAGSPIVVTAKPDDIIVQRVSYADLNLASPLGERALNRRVAYAVNDLCNVAMGETSSSSNAFAYKGCASAAWRGAGPQIAAAVQRAHEIAMTGTSSIAASAITVSLRE